MEFTLEQKESRTPGYAILECIVKDNGIGMSQEFVSHIFDMFSRAQSSSVARTQGTGLGMAIVKRLVEKMNGDVTVESEPGVGTTVCVTFEFKIPTEDEIREYFTCPMEYSKEVSLLGKNVLLVENNDLNRELAKDIIHSGIYLAGGGSQLQHIGDLITSLTNIKVNLSEEPESCVVRGLNHIVSEKQFQSLAYNLKKRIYS